MYIQKHRLLVMGFPLPFSFFFTFDFLTLLKTKATFEYYLHKSTLGGNCTCTNILYLYTWQSAWYYCKGIFLCTGGLSYALYKAKALLISISIQLLPLTEANLLFGPLGRMGPRKGFAESKSLRPVPYIHQTTGTLVVNYVDISPTVFFSSHFAYQTPSSLEPKITKYYCFIASNF